MKGIFPAQPGERPVRFARLKLATAIVAVCMLLAVGAFALASSLDPRAGLGVFVLRAVLMILSTALLLLGLVTGFGIFLAPKD